MGSGKSTVAAQLRDMGFEVLDADKIAHQFLSPGGEAVGEIIQTFGDAVRAQDGGIDRPALGRKVFGDRAALQKLESILHPRVKKFVEVRRSQLAEQAVPVAFYDVPLLFEKKLISQFDKILVVTADEEIRLRRLRERSGLSDSEIRARWKTHVDPAEKVRLASAVISNDGSISDLRTAIVQALRKLGIALPAPTNPNRQ